MSGSLTSVPVVSLLAVCLLHAVWAVDNTYSPAACHLDYDIVFLLENSAGVGRDNFRKMLDFVKDVYANFDVGPSAVQIGVDTFRSTSEREFRLNDSADKNSLNQAVDSIFHRFSSMPRTAAISQALSITAGRSFSAGSGHRNGKYKLVIAVMASNSTVDEETAGTVDRMKKEGIESLGVIVGQDMDGTGLVNITGDSVLVYKAATFDALKFTAVQVAAELCEGCGKKIDIVFLLDNSDSVGQNNFLRVLQFVNEVTNKLYVGPEYIQIGVDTFFTSFKTEFRLNQFVDRTLLNEAINSINYTGGDTNTGPALTAMTSQSFTADSGHRTGVPKLAVVITGGKSTDTAVTTDAALRARLAGIHIIAFGMGRDVDKSELDAIASNPDGRNVFQSSDFDSIVMQIGRLTVGICSEVPDTLQQIRCGSLPSDVEFLLDRSGSIKAENFVKVKNFVKSFAQYFDIGPNGLNMGMATFASDARLEFSLNSYTTRDSLLAAIDSVNYTLGMTYTGKALELIRQKAFTEASGDRDGVSNILIVVTDGKSTNTTDTELQAAKLHNNTDINVFTVGIKNADLTELEVIASQHQNVFYVDNFEALETLHHQLKKTVCDEIPVSPPPDNTTEIPVSPPPSDNTINAMRPLYFHPQPPCVDSITSCTEYGFFYCNPDSLWAQYICRRHCGVCVQHCDYKGQWYSHGAKWQDGCAYDCECVDGATGHYQCYNKCPTYLFPPPHCTLVQLPGLCCLQPVCDFGAVYQTTSGQNVGHLNGYQVCVYNGTKYYQSQRWTVGCDVECFCYDAGIGLYTCHTKCAQYGMLPSNCRLVQKPGECCAKPECEFYTTMGPFTGVGQPSGNGQSVYTVFTF